MEKKKKKLLWAELIIIGVILVVLALSQLVGTTETSITSGTIKVKEDTNGLVFAKVKGKAANAMLELLCPDSSLVEFDTEEAAATGLSKGECDAMVVLYEDMQGILEAHTDLTYLTSPAGYIDGESGEAVLTLLSENISDSVYVLLRKDEFAYSTTDKTLEDVNQPGVRIAVIVGTNESTQFGTLYPQAELVSYDSLTDVLAAIDTGKVDFGAEYDNSADRREAYPNITLLSQPSIVESNSFCATKNERGKQLVEEFDNYFADLQESGEYDRLYAKWKSEDETRYVLEDYPITGENGDVKICVSASWLPMCFYYNNELVGLFIDLMNGFCSAYGYMPEYTNAFFASEIAGVTSGAYDFMADVLSYSEERAESVYFTDTVCVSYVILATLGETETSKTVSKASVFWTDLQDSFYKTFIKENRWEMLLDGLGITALLSILAVLFGSLLGALICRFRMSQNVYLEAFARIYIKLFQGLPIVVLLMILYYVIFGTMDIGAFWVCVIGFSIDFSAYTCEIFRNGIQAVPEGQLVAARALGFDEKKGFRKVVLPQAIRHIMPVYTGQFISLVKLTSVAGYISVQDLTKISDIIRSQTYEAFFPLILTAVVYFIVSQLIIEILKVFERKTDPMQKSRYPKGVKLRHV